MVTVSFVDIYSDLHSTRDLAMDLLLFSCPTSFYNRRLKYKYRNREFWCKGYYVDTVGKNTNRIAEYIKHQLDEDRLSEQLRIPETTTRKK